MKRLSDVKFQARKEKGLCFKCEEKFTVGHKCKARELRAMVVQADGKELEIIEEGDVPNELEAEVDEEIGDVTEFSLNSVVGFTNPSTIKVKGMIDS